MWSMEDEDIQLSGVNRLQDMDNFSKCFRIVNLQMKS